MCLFVCKMCKCINLTIIGFICFVQLCDVNAAALTEHYGQRLTQSNAYLPPYGHSNFGEKTHNVQAENYDPNYSSYVPPASGAASSQYSRTQTISKIPLSTLLPQSVIEQFATPAGAGAYETQKQQQYQQPHQQQQQQIPTTETETVNGNELSMPMLMVEEPVTMYLTSSENKTLEAAKLLASTLLEAQNNNNNNDNDDDDNVSHSNVAMSDYNALNRTDIVVVKAHKNAYIIPAPLTRDGTSTSRLNARELYARRNQLPKAYTINQFVFIIKPERINFLNKLV